MRISDWSSDVCSSDLAGIPARLLRVGFVGELGYEIHVPASQGEALWDALLEAGQPEGIRPFGVEAQRVLRLEKGHIIIGQDTDGLRSEEHTSELQSLMRTSYAVFCLKKKTQHQTVKSHLITNQHKIPIHHY